MLLLEITQEMLADRLDSMNSLEQLELVMELEDFLVRNDIAPKDTDAIDPEWTIQQAFDYYGVHLITNGEIAFNE